MILSTADHILHDIYVKFLEEQNLESKKHTSSCLGLNTELLKVLRYPKTGLG